MAGADGSQNLAKYDSALLGILQHEGTLEPFLDVVFGFLFRKTDFYCTMTESQIKYGFPPGVAEKMVMKCFNKYNGLTKRMEEQAQKIENKPPPNNADNKTTKLNKPQELEDVDKKAVSGHCPEKPVPKVQEEFQLNPDSYNGAVRDRYSWSQNYDDVDVLVPVSKSTVKGRQVKVSIERKHLSVSVLGKSMEMENIIDDELKHEINKQDSMWSLEAGKSIQITLAKDTKYWWNSLLVNEEEIDIQKISPERSMNDMKEDEVAVVNKLQFDERQKRLGLPQSHELKVHEMLKKGWDADGSPFKGQDFDPKMFNISPSGVQ